MRWSGLSQRGQVNQPKVARHELPKTSVQNGFNPNGVIHANDFFINNTPFRCSLFQPVKLLRD